jgi:hypothetical protein
VEEQQQLVVHEKTPLCFAVQQSDIVSDSRQRVDLVGGSCRLCSVAEQQQHLILVYRQRLLGSSSLLDNC